MNERLENFLLERIEEIDEDIYQRIKTYMNKNGDLFSTKEYEEFTNIYRKN